MIRDTAARRICDTKSGAWTAKGQILTRRGRLEQQFSLIMGAESGFFPVRVGVGELPRARL